MTRLALLALLAFASPLKADGPTVEFTLADGWVNLRLHAGDTPVTDAKLVVLVGDGVWAEGETGEKGQGSFLRPKAVTCQVVFIYSTGTSAPVPLTFQGDTLTPTSAAVGGVKPPCCLIAPPESPAPAAEDSPRLWVFAVVLVLGGAVAFVAYRKTMSRITGENA